MKNDLAGLPLFEPPSEPALPPYRRNSESSLAAAVEIRREVNALELKVLHALASGPLVIDGIAKVARRDPAAIRPRVTYLEDAGLVEKTGEFGLSCRRKRQAIVCLTQAGHDALKRAADSFHDATVNNKATAA